MRATSLALLCGVPLLLSSNSYVVADQTAAPAPKPASQTTAPAKSPAAPANARPPAVLKLAPAAPPAAAASAQAAAPALGLAAQVGESVRDLQLHPDQSQILEFRAITQVAIVNPAMADVTLVGPGTMVLTAKAAGETLLFVNHAGGRTVFRVTVSTPPGPDLQQLASQIEAGINRPGISVRALGRNIVVEGEVVNQAELDRINAILRAFSVEAQNLVTVLPGPPPPPAPNPAEVAARAITEALNLPNIVVRTINGRVALEGRVRNAAEAERIRRVVSAVASGVEVIDLLVIPAPEPPTRRQVLIRARIIEINKNRQKDLGFDWGPVVFTPGSDTAAPTFAIGEQPFLFGQTLLGPFESLFGGGGIQRLQPVGYRLNALLRDGAARLLAEPNLTVLEGEAGRILIGGEFPYPSAQSGSALAGGIAAVTIQFRPFGISLVVEPQTITEDEVVLRVVPEVSNLDFRRAITVAGFSLPSLTSRRAESTVRIQNGQSLAIGGLLRDDYSRAVKSVAGFAEIPVLGEYFKTKTFIREETELVIVITPEILGPGQAPSTTIPAGEIRRPPIPQPKIR